MFTRKTLAFLRALKRNNDRDWFRARKADYERDVRAPMLELLARLERDFATFAPELVSDPKVSLYRIYRDTRFSADKSPLKTHVAAHFPTRGLPRGQGAGLYIEIAPTWVWMGGGMYMPSTSDLQAIREHIAATHPRLHRIVSATAFTRVMGPMHGERLTRVPRGYVKDHPAAHYLQFKQFMAGKELAADAATRASFYRDVLAAFRATLPLVRFLNAPLLERVTPAPHPLDDAHRRDLRRAAERRRAPTPMW
jgi:uncharacterized protein (TIGR02453 family)